jgi:hypothetical protein
MSSIEIELAKFAELSTGDEIHLTTGEIWSVVERRCGSFPTGVVIVKGSFAEAKSAGEFNPGHGEALDPKAVRAVFEDAVRGGATICIGVGSAK